VGHRLEQADVEALLTREARARLPLARQLKLYLDPFALFMDASRGTKWMRERALAYNQGRRWILLAYVRRWLLIAGSSFVGIAPTEALAAEVPGFAITAAGLGIGCSIALAVATCAGTAYFLLGLRRDRK
jgi:hypothetical protein